jgi:GGDEF domain-containing protein
MHPTIFPSELMHIGADSYLGAGAVLWREGDPGGDVVLVLDGTLEVFRDTPEGEMVVDAVEPGRAVGELAMDGGIRTASVRAQTACHVLRVGAEPFRRLLRERPDLLEGLYWSQVNRSRRIVRERATVARPRRILDPQSGAYTYPYLLERLEAEFRRAQAAGDSVAVLLCEPDAPVSEAARANLVRALKAHCGRGDLIGRHGESQLVVLAYGADGTLAAEIARSFRQAAAALTPVAIAVSTGVALFPRDGQEVDSILRAADARLYEAREGGKGTT